METLNKETSSQETKSIELGTFLKNCRVAIGLTQSEVAEKLGYGSPQFISNIERGISNVPIKSLRIIVDLYKISATDVLNILLEEKRRVWSEQLGLTNSH